MYTYMYIYIYIHTNIPYTPITADHASDPTQCSHQPHCTNASNGDNACGAIDIGCCSALRG